MVYDECHYFYTDSTFNTYTELSYDCLTHIFDEKIQIFMSATMEKVKELIKDRRPQLINGHSCSKNFDVLLRQRGELKDRIIEYSTDYKYDYLDVISFGEIEEVISAIVNHGGDKKEKWLIFTDSIDRGQEIKKKLLCVKKDAYKIDESGVISKDEIVFIDANYEEDVDGTDSVRELTNNCFISKRIVIATAVMDNGVSFHDEDLRNIVIMADDEESFVQMLGRKRFDRRNSMVRTKLYICKRNKAHFQRRFALMEEKTNVYLNNRNCLDILFLGSIESQGNILPVLVNENKPYYAILFNKKIISNYQQSVLSAMLRNEKMYRAVKSFCYSVGGALAVNYFAISKMINLQGYYQDMIKKIEIDENAFLKEQLKWIGKDDDDVNEIVQKSATTIEESYRNDLRSSLEGMFRNNECCVMMTNEENIAWKKENKNQIIFFLKKGKFEEKDISNIKKGDRTISMENFNECMKLAGISYEMKKERGKDYEIKKLI